MQVLPDGRQRFVLDTRTGEVLHWTTGTRTEGRPSYEVSTLDRGRAPAAGYQDALLRSPAAR